MQLYPHNQKAYDNVVEIFKTENKACVVHPCGTGKSMIICKTIFDNPTSRHLLLGPGIHIEKEIRKHLPDSLQDNLYFSTYVGANEKSKRSRLLFIPNAFGYIYTDEFHRAGPDFSGNNLRRLWEVNPSAKMLGTSATPIRFMDDFRNMATELFNDRIASYMSIPNAIVRGIFSEPDYYYGRYIFHEDLSNMKQNILSMRSLNREKLFRGLSSKEIDWEQSHGLEDVVKELVTPDRRKLIVFCKNLEHMMRVKEMLDPVFKSIYRTVRSLAIHSTLKPSWNERCLAEFSKEDNQAVVLYSVDMVNEGLHSRLCNTVIMLRDTLSATVYYQQIGRAFSIGCVNRPLIIDAVNNCENVRFEEFKREIIREREALRTMSSKFENNKVKVPIEFAGEKRNLLTIIPENEEWMRKENDRNVAGEKLRLELETCVRKIISHFTEGSIYDMKEELRHDFTRIQYRWLDGCLGKDDLANLKAAGVPIEMTPKEISWLEYAKRVITWYQLNRRLPGSKDDYQLYIFWLREEKRREYPHQCAKLFRVNIVADRLFKELNDIILVERGWGRRGKESNN